MTLREQSISSLTLFTVSAALSVVTVSSARAESQDVQAAVPEQTSAGVTAETVLETPLLEDSNLQTESVSINVISPAEFKPAIRYNLPQLVEKRQTEALAATNPYVLLPHRPNYVLPLTYQTRPNNDELDKLVDGLNQQQGGEPGETDGVSDFEHLEAVMQLSIKYVLSEGLLTKLDRIEIAYTNKSFWQAYNSEISKPFRETNHEPEIMYSWLPSYSWLDHMGVSLNHQSNGQTGSLSRSWNRIILEGASVASSNSVWYGRAWWRIPEGKKADPFDPSDNDNPDIEDYLGYGELYYLRVYGNSNVSVMIRNNLEPDENRGALELGWTFPLTRKIKGYFTYFNGYGDSLIDYNHFQERFGLGIKLSDWL